MADVRFHVAAGPFTVAELAGIAGATLMTPAVAGRTIRGVATLAGATAEDVSFLDNRRYAAHLAATQAGACLMRPRDAGAAPAATAVLVTPDPYRAWAAVVAAFHPDGPVAPRVDPGAHVAPSAILGPGCRIAAGATVGAGVRLGARCRIGANAALGEGVTVGEDTWVGAGASLARCSVGARCHIHEGARLGTEGFGFALGPEGHARILHVGRVVVGDDVRIGANTTVDRGVVGDTRIGAGTVIDNLVQIAHNVEIGRGCVIAGQVGISGSATLGDFVVIGGQAGVAGHLTIGSRAVVAARSAVKDDLASDGTYGGAPAEPIRVWRRRMATMQRLTQRKNDDP